MKINLPTDTKYFVIEEEIIRSSAQDCVNELPEGEINNFQLVLNSGILFRAAGLTPVYVVDENFKDLYVFPKEYQTMLLH